MHTDNFWTGRIRYPIGGINCKSYACNIYNLPSLFFLLRAFLRAPAIFNILRPNLPVLSRKPRSRISLARGTSTIHPNTTNIIKSTSLEDAVGGYILPEVLQRTSWVSTITIEHTWCTCPQRMRGDGRDPFSPLPLLPMFHGMLCVWRSLPQLLIQGKSHLLDTSHTRGEILY